MPKKLRNKKSSQTSVIIASLLLLLSLPLLVYGLFQKSFDIRNRAYDMLELSEKNPCLISFPNVNPYSLEVGKAIRVQVDAKFSNSGIRKLEISDPTGKNIYTEEFDDSPLQIGTSFVFTPEKSGNVEMLGMIEKTDGKSAGCKISSPYDIKGLKAVASNSSPEFTTSPSQSKPSQDIKTGTQYEYQLSATDTDRDRINYSYSFTPRADWLKPVIIEDGSNGKLTITFRGYTEEPASYLANVIIHDGYSKHVRSQSWVISVEQAENDIPKVKIVRPEDALRIDTGSKFDSSWEVSDLNHITSFELFMTKNVADETTWEKVSEKLEYNVLGSPVSTNNLDSGTYKLVVRATDNQTPPKSGFGVSPEIVISKASDKTPESDDVVVLGEPQVINMSPSTEDVVSNPRVTIKGTLIASEDAEIKETSIIFKVDDKDVTDKMKINKISDKEYTLIYQPTQDLVDGTHKGEISFEDTKGKKAEKSWDFTINSTADTSGTYNIFGLEVSKRTVFIIGVGILLIVIAICIPLLIAAIWGKGKKEKDTTYATRNTPLSTEYTEEVYTPPVVNTEVRELVEADATPPDTSPIKEKEIYSSVSNIDMGETDTKVEEPMVETEVKVDVPDVKIEPKIKEPTFSPNVQTTEPSFKNEIPDVKVEPAIEEPKSAFDVKPQPKIEETKPAFDVKVQPTKEEPKSAFDVTPQPTQPEAVTEPTTIQQEPIVADTSTTLVEETPVTNLEPTTTFETTTTTQETPITEPMGTDTSSEEIPEPEAPDPSAFLKIAQQIEEQTKEDSTNT